MNPLTSLQLTCVRSRGLTLNALFLRVLTMLLAVPTLAASSGTRTLIGILHVAREDFAETLLTNRQVLVVGRLDSANNVLASARVYTPWYAHIWRGCIGSAALFEPSLASRMLYEKGVKEEGVPESIV